MIITRLRFKNTASCTDDQQQSTQYVGGMAKFSSFEEFYGSLPADQEQAIRRLVNFVAQRRTDLELVIAWNQPMFKLGRAYIIGFMPTKNHINLLTVTDTPVTAFAERIQSFTHGTRSIALPFDWQIDGQLVDDIIEFRIRETS